MWPVLLFFLKNLLLCIIVTFSSLPGKFKYSLMNNFLSWWNYSQLRFNWTKEYYYIYTCVCVCVCVHARAYVCVCERERERERERWEERVCKDSINAVLTLKVIRLCDYQTRFESTLSWLRSPYDTLQSLIKSITK